MQELSANEKGTRAEGAVLSALLRCGYNVLIPFGPARYDLVREKDGRFERIQCKTAALTKTGALRFAVTNTPPSMTHKTYVGEVDFFGVYSPDLERVYLVPIEAVASYKREMWLRLEASRNGQVNGTNLAAKFLLVPSEAA
jgi:hypothetical protein